MNPHLRLSLIGLVKFLLISGAIVSSFYYLIQFIVLDFDAIFNFGLYIIFGTIITGVVIWILFKMISEIFKRMLGRCEKIDEIFLLNNELYISCYYVHSGADDGPDSGNYFYKINMESGKLIFFDYKKFKKIKELKPDAKTHSKKNKNFDLPEFTILCQEHSILAKPFRTFFGFDSGYKILKMSGESVSWIKKV